MRKVLVTGSTGGLGRALVPLLEAGADEVVCVSRGGAPVAARTVVVSDLLAAPWGELTAGCDAVFHLAAHVHRAPGGEDEHRRVNAEGTAAIARACSRSGALLVFASTVAVLGAGGAGAGDDAREAPVTAYGHSKWLAEQAIRAEDGSGLRSVVLRFPLLYGPHGRGNMERMLRAIRRRRFWPVGDQRVRKSCLYFDDAARALVAAARESSVRGERFVVAPPTPVSLGEIHDVAYRLTGRGKPPRAVPASVAALAARAGDAILSLTGRTGRLKASIAALTANAWFDGSRFARATGFVPSVPLEEGLRRTLHWIEAEGP